MNGDKDLQQHLWLGQWVLLGPLKSSIHRRCATLTDKKWLQDASSTVRQPPLQNHLQRRPRDGATFACQRPTQRRRSKPQSWKNLKADKTFDFFGISLSLYSLSYLFVIFCHSFTRNNSETGRLPMSSIPLSHGGTHGGTHVSFLQRSAACRCGQTCPRRLALRPRCRPAFTRPVHPFIRCS